MVSSPGGPDFSLLNSKATLQQPGRDWSQTLLGKSRRPDQNRRGLGILKRQANSVAGSLKPRCLPPRTSPERIHILPNGRLRDLHNLDGPRQYKREPRRHKTIKEWAGVSRHRRVPWLAEVFTPELRIEE